eukprot:8913529-Heterocapsa_arctica.AAC.1
MQTEEQMEGHMTKVMLKVSCCCQAVVLHHFGIIDGSLWSRTCSASHIQYSTDAVQCSTLLLELQRGTDAGQGRAGLLQHNAE